MNNILLKIYNRNGSVQHYYHYLLGFLMPLCINWDRIQDDTHGSNITVRSCALMDRLTLELNFENLNIIDYDPSLAIRDTLATVNYDRIIELEGYDFTTYYDAAEFLKFKEFVYKRLKIYDSIKPYGKIVLIDRLPPDPFYLSNNSEYVTASAGSDRRSIPNIMDIKKCIDSILGNTHVVTLENMTLSSQVEIFSSADIIIAQHGASMANLVWAKPGTIVIEIIPRQMAGLLSIFDFFGDLCRCLGLQHKIILQDDYHAAVDIDILSTELKTLALRIIKSRMKNWGSKVKTDAYS